MTGSPWGKVQHSEPIARGVRRVSTAGHGGFMVSPGFAGKHLSNAARKRGVRYGDYLCYEEDADYAIVLFEIYTNPELRQVAEEDVKRYFTSGRTVEEQAEKLRVSLSAWNADYLEERGEPVHAKNYRSYLYNRWAYGAKLPDLILTGTVRAEGEALIVQTADGQKHRVKQAPPFEKEHGYWSCPRLTFLSQVEAANA